LHGTAHQLKGSATDPERLNRKLGHTAALKINNQPIPYLPPTETYKYLGVHLCPALIWDKQLRETIKHVNDTGNKLARSLASPRQCLQILKTVIKPAVSYAFCVAPYTMSEIYELDKAIARVARTCCRLGRSFPTAAILLGETAVGAGVISLTVDYAQISAACLVRAMDDADRLGIVTTALLQIQRDSCRGNAAVEEVADEETRFYTGLRQMCVMKSHGLQLTIKGEIYKESTLGEGDEMDERVATLLRSQRVPRSLMNPLHRVGVKHVGELITDKGTHLISTDDLTRTYGSKVTAREKKALN
jgi:hypothetical protein